MLPDQRFVPFYRDGAGDTVALTRPRGHHEQLCWARCDRVFHGYIQVESLDTRSGLVGSVGTQLSLCFRLWLQHQLWGPRQEAVSGPGAIVASVRGGRCPS